MPTLAEQTKPDQTRQTPPEPFFGAIADTSSETDWQFGAAELELPIASKTFSDEKNLYNQDFVSPNSCTLHGAIGAYSDLTGYVFQLEERKALWAQAIEQGASDTDGWYINKAVDLVRKYINGKNPDNQVVTFRVFTGGDDMRQALDLGYSVVTGYRGNQNYNNDAFSDGTLDGDNFSNLVYGHCIRITKSAGDEYEIIVDNYPQRENPTYRIKWDTLKKLIDNNVFFVSGYVFVLKNDYLQMKKEELVSPWARQSVQKCIAKGIMQKWDNPQEVVAPAGGVLEWSLFNLGALTKTGEAVTKERLAVAYDRLGLLG